MVSVMHKVMQLDSKQLEKHHKIGSSRCTFPTVHV